MFVFQIQKQQQQGAEAFSFVLKGEQAQKIIQQNIAPTYEAMLSKFQR